VRARPAARPASSPGAMRLMMPGPVDAPPAGAHLLGADRRRARRGVVGRARAPRAPEAEGLARGAPGPASSRTGCGPWSNAQLHRRGAWTPGSVVALRGESEPPRARRRAQRGRTAPPASSTCTSLTLRTSRRRLSAPAPLTTDPLVRDGTHRRDGRRRGRAPGRSSGFRRSTCILPSAASGRTAEPL
jgi:hypothetical protein